MGMSDYYRDLREKIGDQLIFMPSVAAIIRNEEDRILFCRKHNETLWGLVAGAIELGETPAEAMIREAKEETGLTVDPVGILGVYGGKEKRYTYSNGHQVEYLTIVFECKVLSGELDVENEEMCELAFFAEDDLPPTAVSYPKSIFTRFGGEAADFHRASI
ncbi:NUDIX domain-containing protein [Paenibacillus sp. JCM 10914]|uniref:NUDIX domain-containing protein n=1 Tax=Paenibacillus sp. JCM 10914 TaxID=1236974 RepID=UPI0003CC5C55|nr:NUDIX domain-containing protein [Paenibacillus sp. JCM 10914]GAE06875.1 MutT/nudix family protein [Paenibacillus sp. JCM 10914]